MMGQEGLSFLPSGLATILGCVILVVAACFCWTAWQRSGFRSAIGWMEMFRFVLVLLVVVTLWQPEWVSFSRSDQSDVLVVLADTSDSMLTKDVIDDTSADGQIRSRADAIQPFVEDAFWDFSSSAGSKPTRVVFETFSSQLEPAQQASDLNAGLLQVLETHSQLRGVVLLSDGDWNFGQPPIQAATRYRMKGVPVFAVGIGSRTPLPDLELVGMDAPTFAVAHKPLRIPFNLSSSLGQDRDVFVRLYVDGEQVAEEMVRIAAMGKKTQSLNWTPRATGDVELELVLSNDPMDLIEENNRITAPMSVREEQLKVLVVESYPRWEYRYLRNALERDPGVEVTCLLFHPKLSQVGGGRSYIKEFPTASELSRFDVVFLGDVGIGPKQMTAEQALDLKQLVSSQASGLVFIPGRYGWQESLASSPLEELYPVLPDLEQPKGIGTPDKGHFSLTESGRRSLLTKLADTDEENAEIWRRLPGFNWYAGIQRAKVGTEILAVHERASAQGGRVPLIVTKTFGTGKVLFMGTDGAWRWREGVEDRYHYRFWGQVARWMAYQRQKAQGKSMRLFFSPERPRVDDQVTLNANVLDELGGFLDEGSVVVETQAPSGKKESIRLQAGEGDARGLFSGTFAPKEPGPYRLIATSEETGASIETDLSVFGAHRERQGRQARFDVLEEIASVTHGKLVDIHEVGQLLQHLRELPEPEPVLHRTRLWAHPVWCGFLIFMMGIFWIGRKMTGTI